MAWTPRRAFAAVAVLVASLLLLDAPAPAAMHPRASSNAAPAAAAAATAPNIFIYHVDDLRDAIPGGIDPMQFMPKALAWMSDGRRYTQSFISDPSCCPSRASMMTGRYPHNSGVPTQQAGPSFDGPHSMACYLQGAGYATYE